MSTLRSAALTQPWAVRTAWCSWVGVILVVSLLVLAGNGHTVAHHYRHAANHWCAGDNVYTDTGHGFLYLPSAAVLFVPFAAIPESLGEILWRMATIGTFTVGLWRIATLTGRTTGIEMFPLMTLFALPPALSDARNGQATLIMTGLMMLATVDLVDRRWWRAALWLSLGLALKPLALVMILLVAAIERPMTWRLAVGVALTLLIPFLAQRPLYVTDQYAKCVGMLCTASNLGLANYWSQPFSALALAGFEIPERTQTLIRAGAAFLALGLCWHARRQHDQPRAMLELFAISVIYILLFNPRTENNTYEMLGPVLGISAVSALLVERRHGATALLGAMMLAIFCGEEVCRLVWPSISATWLKSLVGIGYLIYFLAKFFERQTPWMAFPASQTAATAPGQAPPFRTHRPRGATGSLRRMN